MMHGTMNIKYLVNDLCRLCNTRRPLSGYSVEWTDIREEEQELSIADISH